MGWRVWRRAMIIARLREARAALEAEGLTSSRLSVTAMRLGRARAALEELSAKAYSAAVFKSDTGQIVFNKRALLQQPDEIILRVMLMAMERLNRAEYYAPRLERVETILADMIAAAPFRKRTLGGVIFSRDDGADNAAGHIILESNVTIKGNELNGNYASGGEEFSVLIPPNENVVDRLAETSVQISAKNIDPNQISIMGVLVSLLPVLLLVGVWIFFMRQMQGGKGGGAMSFGKSRTLLRCL